MTREFVDALGDLLTDYLGIVIDIESTAQAGYKGIYSVKELRVMHMVFRCWRRGEPGTVTQIANETGISKTTVSRAITTLMTNGLLKEQPDPEDGRRRHLLPTAQGQVTLDNVNAWLSLWADRLQEIMAHHEPSIIAPEPTPVADKVVADNAVADKVVADNAVADKVVADNAVADKVVADKVVAVEKIVAGPESPDQVAADAASR